MAVKKADPSLTKQSYALKAVKPGDESIMERYMCHSSGKGAPVVVLHSQGLEYSLAWCDLQNAAFYDAQDAFRVAKKAKSLGGAVEQVYERVKSKSQSSRMDVINTIISMWREQKRSVDVRYMRTVINGVMLQLEDKSFENKLVAELFSEFTF